MTLNDYDIILRRLREDHLELVRNWRNDPKISGFMEFRDYITPEMQRKWFQKINNENNYYFIIEYLKHKIGLINVRDIDYQKMEGEAGIFIYEEEWLNSTVSFQATLCLYDFCFEKLGLVRLIAHIINDNKRAIKFNKMIGFKLAKHQETIFNQLYTLTYDDYLENRILISQIFNK
ncbi:MAG TPA: GNAT family N-acetyltransferase [Candidatus Cloacimonadota bacterium]|nr:GNAT family N-acetyltransferase [Candidatus Cloacimonadota bacterium]